MCNSCFREEQSTALFFLVLIVFTSFRPTHLPQFCLKPGSLHSLFDQIKFLDKDAMRSKRNELGALATTRLHWLWVWNGAQKYWEMFYWNGNGNGNGNGKCSMKWTFPATRSIDPPIHRLRHYSKTSCEETMETAPTTHSGALSGNGDRARNAWIRSRRDGWEISKHVYEY